VSKVEAGWTAALEWAARYVETHPAPLPSPENLAMTIRAKKADVDMEAVGLATAMQVYEQKRAERMEERNRE
jgi:hypothetical protein